MELLSLEGTFGVLERQRLEFAPGFCFFYLPNEAGKTTWTAFLKVMLFGLNTAERDTRTALADKNRYQPPGGQGMEGALRLRRDDGRVLLIRRWPGRGGAPLQSFSAVYEDSGQSVEGMTAKNCGQMLTGLSEESFLNCAMVSGGDLQPGCSDQLEQKILSLAATGDSTAAYSRAYQQLERRRLDLRANARSGREPQLLGELDVSQRQLAQYDEYSRQIEDLQRQLEKREPQLRQEQACRQREKTARLAQAAARTLSARVQLGQLTRQLEELEGQLPSDEQLLRAQRQADAWQSAQNIWRREKELNDAAEGQFTQKMEALYERERQYRQALEEREKYHVRGFALVLAAVFLTVSLIGFFFPLHLPWITPYETPVFFALFLVMLAVALSGLRGRPPEPEVFDWEQEKQELSQRRREAAQPLRLAEGERERQRRALLEACAPLGRHGDDEQAALRMLAEKRGLVSRREQVLRQLEQARRELAEAEHSQQEREKEAPSPTQEDPLLWLHRQLAQLEGQRGALGARQGLAQRCQDLQAQLEACQAEQKAVALAQAALRRANEHLAARVSPVINRAAAAYLARLTAGAYEAVEVGQKLASRAKASGISRPRGVLELSDGTRDQLYLALRLAVCQVVLPPQPRVPLILDDVLLTFDEERMKNALALLRAEGERRQVIVFSCRKEVGR